MATLGEVTVPINFVVTETSKEVLRPLVAGLLADVLEEAHVVFPTEAHLRAFLQAEVKKALVQEMREMGMQGRPI